MPGLLLSSQPPQAPMVVGPTTKSATRPDKALPQYLIDDAKRTVREEFDASRHLSFEPPKNIVKMKDIGLEGHGISPNAVSDPFPLFSKEAVEQIRAEVFSEDVLRECQFASTFNKNMVRGWGRRMYTAIKLVCLNDLLTSPDNRRAPFTYGAWKSPELAEMISRVAGIDLVPSIDFEIANINISVNTEDADVLKSPTGNEPLGDGLSSVAWHYDSFPFVCVVMLSDCSDMIGGETALRTSTGDIMKVRGPAMGTAVVLQGRYIEHQALKAMGGKERISMVTCFRPKSPLVRDETVLTGVRGISHKSELYNQYTEYRLEILEERIRAKMRDERDRAVAKKPFDTLLARTWLIEQKDFIESMLYELTEE